ncbi:hypothetical protein CDEF62S_02569 [Castellaniella defragrans]
MELHMVFDDLGHEPVDRSAYRRDLMQDFAAALFGLKRPFKCYCLTLNTAHSRQQFGFLADRVTNFF